MGDMSDIDRFITSPKPDPIERPSRHHPTGWEPGVDTSRGVIVSPPTDSPEEPDWAEILEQFRLDPERWQVDSDTVHVRTWDSAVGAGEVRRFFYFKADVRPRVRSHRADVDQLIKMVSGHRFKRPASVTEPSALVVCLADWQAGPDPKGLVDAVLSMKNRVSAMLRDRKYGWLYVVGMGDMVEGCGNNWYAMQDWTVAAGGLNGMRDQEKLVRRLLVDLLQEWSRHVPQVVVGCVPGNHGENRRGGKAFTTLEDNADLSVFEQTAEIFAANPETYGHVRFVVPDGDMSLTLDVAGTVVGFIHGHQAARGGATPQQKVDAWWKGKQKGRHPIGDADVLVNGHYHHACLVEDGPRTWMQAPAMANSRWWEESGGQPTKWGTLTFEVGPDGWDNYRLVR